MGQPLRAVVDKPVCKCAKTVLVPLHAQDFLQVSSAEQ